MLWILAIPLALASPTGPVAITGMTTPPLAYASKAQCDAVANFVSAKEGKMVECRGVKIIGGPGATEL